MHVARALEVVASLHGRTFKRSSPGRASPSLSKPDPGVGHMHDATTSSTQTQTQTRDLVIYETLPALDSERVERRSTGGATRALQGNSSGRREGRSSSWYNRMQVRWKILWHFNGPWYRFRAATIRL